MEAAARLPCFGLCGSSSELVGFRGLKVGTPGNFFMKVGWEFLARSTKKVALAESW